jgi:hypothetical protein
VSGPLDHRGDRTGRDHEPLARRRLGARETAYPEVLLNGDWLKCMIDGSQSSIAPEAMEIARVGFSEARD